MVQRQTLETLAIGGLATVTLQQGIAHYVRYSSVPDLAHPTPVDVKWYPPRASRLNDFDTALSSNGTHGYGYFDGSDLAPGVGYGTYNHANMPHVRRQEYPRPGPGYSLRYVEVIHRHHKRTPYDHSCFPRESYRWDCDDEALIHRATPRGGETNRTADTFWSIYESAANPFGPPGCRGTCTFPQLTRGGLDDSWRHGRDLYEAYSSIGFLGEYNASVEFRVTNNPITSQVAGMVVSGMFPHLERTGSGLAVPLRLQPAGIDSLEPRYRCARARELYDSFGYGSRDPVWVDHLARTRPLRDALDAISRVPAEAADWHGSWDHYFDNLAMRLAHGKPLPCLTADDGDGGGGGGDGPNCVTREQADRVFRIGMWEYDWIFRSAGQRSLDAAVGSYGVWLAELAHNLRESAGGGGGGGVVYRHNVAHDGSMARLLAILQVEDMVWPGMGSELVFEVWTGRSRDGDGSFLRLLWGGRVFRSSSPTLGTMDMVPLDRVLRYFDALVGPNASEVVNSCRQ